MYWPIPKQIRYVYKIIDFGSPCPTALICVPLVVTLLDRTPMFWVVYGNACCSEQTPNIRVLPCDWTMCSTYRNHFRSTYEITSRERASSLWPLIVFTSQLWFSDLKWPFALMCNWNHITQFLSHSNWQNICGVGSVHNRTAYLKGVTTLGDSDSHLCVVIGLGQLMHQSWHKGANSLPSVWLRP